MPIPSILTSYGLGLSTALTVSVSAARDTEKPSFTSAAACFLLAGVIRFRVPISSSLPQRPQLDRSFFQRSYCASVTTREVAVWDDSLPAGSATISNTNSLAAKVLMVILLPTDSRYSGDFRIHTSCLATIRHAPLSFTKVCVARL